MIEHDPFGLVAHFIEDRPGADQHPILTTQQIRRVAAGVSRRLQKQRTQWGAMRYERKRT